LGGLTGLDGKVEDLVNRLDLRVRRCVKHDDDRAYEAYRATELAQGPQLFVEEEGSENGTYYDAQGAEWCHENCWRKRVGGKVTGFPGNDCATLVPPLAEISPFVD
jgi:hypothetical protein